MALTGITVVEIRGGRPVLRAANLTEHLAPLLDEAAHRRGRAAGAVGRALAAPGRAVGAPAAPAAAGTASRSSETRSRRVRVADGVEARAAERGPAYVGLDLGRRRPSGGRRSATGTSSPSAVGVLVDRLGGPRPEAEPRRRPGHRPATPRRG